ncbi:Fur family transcriptional regulator [Paenibacillus sp. GCM10023248]|uniref:Fur family transcriptional regulator n=1 Tax=Bacillales TaxID=1385 RepID=UPI0023793EC4|nr:MULTISPECIES: transcriptional repressor [Bacillales]MDD9271422.1 transcriptional repressor [Paenibacillus sp. MAHUQ-63]MDR6884363.1 Fur family peroxide stress response transcriptional regulator [Bacillus sp. 3255]
MARHDLNQALQRMRAKNIPLTPQRQALLTYLYDQNGYTTVKEICEALVAKYPTINAMTINSSLHVFKQLGLVKELAMSGSSMQYEAALSS